MEVIDDPSAHHELPMNFVALEPGAILLPKGDGRMRERYEQHGVSCIEVDVSELIKAGGGIHCMTGFLKRDPL
jgi:arginine deiminase